MKKISDKGQLDFKKLISGLALMEQYNDSHINHLKSNFKALNKVSKGMRMKEIEACSSIALKLVAALEETTKQINEEIKLMHKLVLTDEENGN